MRAEVNGVSLGYEVFGSGALALVLLHAFPLHRGMWRAQAKALAGASGLRVVTPDFRGFGESDVVAGPTTMEQLAVDTLALLDQIVLDKVVLGGLSMGGYVAFACLRGFPERVRGLILADTRASADSQVARAAREANARLAEEQGVAVLFERDSDKYFGHVTLHEHPETVARARAMAVANPPEGVAAALRGMALRPDSTDLLPRIACPTLVIVGEQDALTPVADARALFERIPNAQLEVLADAGHLSNLEQPAEFTAIVARFLQARLPAS
jgi:pimeloyl-ACP methyl ester carboxylesterase